MALRMLPSRPQRRWAAGVCGFLGLLLCLQASALCAAPPTVPAERAKVVGAPASLDVQPAKLMLAGPRALQQIVVTGRYADGTVRDLTSLSSFKADDAKIIHVSEDGFAEARGDGATTLTIQVGTQTAKLPVTVTQFGQTKPVSFRHDVIAALSVGGCNAGACHGTPSGKNGFKLSLRGYDPTADYEQLTRDVLGRRTDRNSPEASLLYVKGLGRVPHEGGSRFAPSSIPAQTILAWLSEGLQDDPATLPALKKIEVLPGNRQLQAPSRWQQLAVLAHYADGSVRDVTRLTVFSSSESAVADVSNTGLVEFGQSGEVAILCRYLDEMQAVRLMYLEPRPGFQWSNPAENNFVDKHAFNKLKMLNILPSDLCTDQEFVRRAYMDVCGILPNADEVRSFLDSKEPTKRAKLIDSLLERPEYADFFTLKWSDVLRSNRKTIQLKGVYGLQGWLHSHIAQNTPFDQVTHEILTATGSTFTNPPANYYRITKDPTQLAETTAQLFFGIRMQCAKCHNHPFERWTQDDYYSLAAFFNRVKERKDPMEGVKKDNKYLSEFVYIERSGEVTQPRTGKAMPPRFMGGGGVPEIAAGKDRREVFAKWLTGPTNPFFAKSVVNRLWFHIMGKGIVDPVDDFRDSNPSANDELLDALAKDFIASKFDIKHTLRTILNSRTYQLSSRTNDFNKDDNKYFSHAVTKLYTAEQLFDAICFVTGVPEKFAGMPLGTRAVQLPDGEANHPFLKTFGQPARELACECERESDSNLAQALQLINGATVNDRLRSTTNRISVLLAKKLPERDMLNDLYLVTLSRPPSESEVKAALEHVTRSMDKRRAWEDVQWALINAKEFLFRH